MYTVQLIGTTWDTYFDRALYNIEICDVTSLVVVEEEEWGGGGCWYCFF